MAGINLLAKLKQFEDEISALTGMVNKIYDHLGLEKHGIPRLAKPAPTTGISAPTVTTNLKGLTAGRRSQAKSEDPVAVANTKTFSDISSLEPYRYSPLNPQASEIRVLILQPAADPAQPIQCQLAKVSLDNVGSDVFKPKGKHLVMTLSYTWGDPSNPEPIVVDGKLLRVTRNLHAAMKHFRTIPTKELATLYATQMRQPLYWWIDAICINQEDLDERSSQVALMTRLYRHSLIGHVWLGPEADDSLRAMDLIRKIGYIPKSVEAINAWRYRPEPGQTHQYMGPGLLPRALESPAPVTDEDKRSNYEALVKLFNRDWFSRVWVRQEFALPPDIKFHCGSQVCTWQELTKAAAVLTYLTDDLRIPELQAPEIRKKDSQVTCFRRIDQLRQLRAYLLHLTERDSEDPYLPMRVLIFHARDSKATDPRDKIYSMLPLASPQRTGLSADYRQSNVEVFKSAVLDSAKTSLNFLCACQYPESGKPQFPSWIPDLTRPWNFIPMIMYSEIDGPHGRAAGKDFIYDLPEFEYLPEELALKVRGMTFDKICDISDDVAAPDSSPSDLHALRTKWWAFYQNATGSGSFEYPRQPRDDSYGHRHFGPGALQPRDLWEPRTSSIWGEADYPRRSTSNRNLFQSGGGFSTFHAYDAKADSPELRLAAGLLSFSLPAPMTYLEYDRPKKIDIKSMGELHDVCYGRKFARTEQNAFGFIPAAARPGDVICQIKGSLPVFVIRKDEKKADRWILIGDAYFFFEINYSWNHRAPVLQDIILV